MGEANKSDNLSYPKTADSAILISNDDPINNLNVYSDYSPVYFECTTSQNSFLDMSEAPKRNLEKPNYQLCPGFIKHQKQTMDKWILPWLQQNKNLLLMFSSPVLFFPLLFNSKLEYKCLFTVLLMAYFWTLEILPLPVTALLPLILFPLTGVLPGREVAREILLGFITVTAALSMFISNTATTAMMLPIVESTIRQLIQSHRSAPYLIKNQPETHSTLIDKNDSTKHSENHLKLGHLHAKEAGIAKALILSIAFAANIGGTGTFFEYFLIFSLGTLTGTPPNLILMGILNVLYPNVKNTGVNYLSWMGFAVPLMILCLLALWIILLASFVWPNQNIRKRRPSTCADVKEETNLNTSIQQRYNQLEPMSFDQKSMCFFFLFLLILWIGRDPQIVPGFGSLFKDGFYTDATSVILISILLFIWPKYSPFCVREKKQKSTERLMDWPTMQAHFPWGVVILLGGGFALAAGIKSSGLSSRLSNWLVIATHIWSDHPSLWALQLVCIVSTMLVTNICSNTVTASIFIPIAEQAGFHPLSLMLPTTIVCSMAFVLPVGTPSNAIIFSTSNHFLSVRDMMMIGVQMSIVCIVILIVYLATFAQIIFPLSLIDSEWLLSQNTTDLLIH